MKTEACITQSEALDYEIRGSSWAGMMSTRFMQRIAGRYFARKTCRKYRRYLESKAEEGRIAILTDVKYDSAAIHPDTICGGGMTDNELRSRNPIQPTGQQRGNE